MLSEWLSQKVTLHDDDLEHDPDLRENDPWRKEELGSKARREWDNLLEGNLEELGIDATPRVKGHQQESGETFFFLFFCILILFLFVIFYIWIASAMAAMARLDRI